MFVCGKLATKLYMGPDCNGVKREQVLWPQGGGLWVAPPLLLDILKRMDVTNGKSPFLLKNEE